MKKTMTRKEFLRVLASAGTAAALSPLLAACQKVAQPPAPLTLATSTTASTSTPTRAPLSPTAVPVTETPVIAARLERFPQGVSRVVQTHFAGVWVNGKLDAQALEQMLDSAVARLLDVKSADEAWRALFKPTEKVALKVNTISSSNFWTPVELVMAAVRRLQSVGIRAENILIFDRSDSELRRAGFTLNRNGPGVRCYGTEGAYNHQETVAGRTVGVSDLVYQADALINLPLLKQHDMAGISFSMKNHYGTIDQPGNYHNGDALVNGLAELNALPVIQQRTRLIIGSLLNVCLRNWNEAETGDSILVSLDPAAHDAVGLDLFGRLSKEKGRNPAGAQTVAAGWLGRAAQLELGIDDLSKIDRIEEVLS